MKVYSVTDVGKVRQTNQDCVYVSEQPVGNLPNLFIVADGMGGHNAGDFASSYAVRILVESIQKDTNFNPVKIIRRAVETANRRLIEKARNDKELGGMGTTIVAATIVGHYIYVANVGDSRLYIMDPDIEQITRDHSLVEEMVRLGELKREDARNHPDKNIITRALGAKEEVEIDFFDEKLNPGSKIIMCSDGLSNMISDEQIQEVLEACSMDENPAEKLVDRANENGGKDNIAVIVAEPFIKEVRVC